MVKKLIEVAGQLAKALLPMAGDLAKLGLETGGKIAGTLGKRALGLAKGKGGVAAKRFAKKQRKLLRKTALISGCVLALSVTGLFLSRKK